jgi:hypothetical protein
MHFLPTFNMKRKNITRKIFVSRREKLTVGSHLRVKFLKYCHVIRVNKRGLG